jgi:hypothetical protein
VEVRTREEKMTKMTKKKIKKMKPEPQTQRHDRGVSFMARGGSLSVTGATQVAAARISID